MEDILPRKIFVLFSVFACLGTVQLRSDVMVVPTIAGLRAVSVANLTNDTVALVIDYYDESEAVHTGGYFTRGRGGGHFRFRWNTNSPGIAGYPRPVDDGGYWVAPNSTTNGFWERMLHGETPNVKMWGAKGNGVANQSEADCIQRAMNACSGSFLGSELLFPRGDYVVTNTLVFWSTLHLRGESIQATIRMPVGIQKDILRTANANIALGGQSGTVNYDHDLLVENLYICFEGDQTNRNTNNSCLVVCNPGELSQIRNLSLKNGAFGIRCLGGGAPGITLRNISGGYQSIATINVEPIPGSGYALGGPLTLAGISADYFYYDTWITNTCLIRFSNCLCSASISDVKAEGSFGGGVIQYRRPEAAQGWGPYAFGSLSIHHMMYNGSGEVDLPRDIVVLLGNERTPSVLIDQIHANDVRYLIRDDVTGRKIDADVQVFGGLAQDSARLPLHYEGYAGDTNAWNIGSRLIQGQTAFAYLYATNTGWYRVLQPVAQGSQHMAGKLVVSSHTRESTEIQFDVSPGWGTPSITVTRATASSTGPVVTQARAFHYWNSDLNGFWAGVDVYVGNPISSSYQKMKRITFAHDIDGVEGYDTGQIQLIDPIPVSASLPSGASSTTVNTYR